MTCSHHFSGSHPCLVLEWPHLSQVLGLFTGAERLLRQGKEGSRHFPSHPRALPVMCLLGVSPALCAGPYILIETSLLLDPICLTQGSAPQACLGASRQSASRQSTSLLPGQLCEPGSWKTIRICLVLNKRDMRSESRGRRKNQADPCEIPWFQFTGTWGDSFRFQ